MESKTIKPGKTTIKWMPRKRCIIVSDDERNDADKKRMAAIGLIDVGAISDSERLRIGATTKSAELANKASEEQKPYKLLAIGEDSDYEIGDMVLFQTGCQGTGIEVDGKFYLQLGEFEILGKFID